MEKDKYNELIYDRLFNNYPDEVKNFFDNEVVDQWINYGGDEPRNTDGIFLKLKNGKMLHLDIVEVL